MKSTAARRVIPIVDDLGRRPAPDRAAGPGKVTADGEPLDRFDRPLHDLRISVTDRCNFRCTYCMPKDVFDRDHRYLPQVSC